MVLHRGQSAAPGRAHGDGRGHRRRSGPAPVRARGRRSVARARLHPGPARLRGTGAGEPGGDAPGRHGAAGGRGHRGRSSLRAGRASGWTRAGTPGYAPESALRSAHRQGGGAHGRRAGAGGGWRRCRSGGGWCGRLRGCRGQAPARARRAPGDGDRHQRRFSAEPSRASGGHGRPLPHGVRGGASRGLPGRGAVRRDSRTGAPRNGRRPVLHGGGVRRNAGGLPGSDRRRRPDRRGSIGRGGFLRTGRRPPRSIRPGGGAAAGKDRAGPERARTRRGSGAGREPGWMRGIRSPCSCTASRGHPGARRPGRGRRRGWGRGRGRTGRVPRHPRPARRNGKEKARTRTGGGRSRERSSRRCRGR